MQRVIDLVLNVIGDFTLDGSRVVQQGRAFVIGDQLVIFKRNGTKAEVAYRATVQSFERAESRRLPHIVTTDTGTWSLREVGCGCGSPIKRVRLSDARAALEPP